jgi:GNAT superfamily N-acetyltransferase
MKIVKALPEDAGELSSIARSAKAHLGYPESWLKRWNELLTITPEYISLNPTFCAVSGGHIVGFCALILRGGEAQLDHLWVLPSAFGMGAGRILFEWAEKFARDSRAAILRVESDPHAEEFYIHMGATRCGQVSAEIDGHERFLPLLEKAL